VAFGEGAWRQHLVPPTPHLGTGAAPMSPARHGRSTGPLKGRAMPAGASPPCPRERGSSSGHLQPSLDSVVPRWHRPLGLRPRVQGPVPTRGVGSLALEMAGQRGGLSLLLLGLAVLDIPLGKG